MYNLEQNAADSTGSKLNKLAFSCLRYDCLWMVSAILFKVASIAMPWLTKSPGLLLQL